MKTINVGFIGTGAIAKKHMENLKKIEGVNLVAFMNRSEEKAQKAKNQYGTQDAKVYQKATDLIHAECVDVVHVCTANDTHHTYAIEALEAGKHVMVEKPLASTLENASRMHQASLNAKGLLSVNYQNRFKAEVRKLKSLVEKGIFGEVYYVKAHALRRAGLPTWGAFTDKSIQGGGPLIDIGSHALDLAFYVMGDYAVRSVRANVYDKLKDRPHGANIFGNWKDQAVDVEDSVFAFITMKSGATVTLECSFLLHTMHEKEADIRLSGTLAGADFHKGLRVNTVKHDAFFEAQIPLTECDPYYESMLSWIEAVRSKNSPRVKAEEAFAVSCVIEAIYESARINKEVVMDDFLRTLL